MDGDLLVLESIRHRLEHVEARAGRGANRRARLSRASGGSRPRPPGRRGGRAFGVRADERPRLRGPARPPRARRGETGPHLPGTSPTPRESVVRHLGPDRVAGLRFSTHPPDRPATDRPPPGHRSSVTAGRPPRGRSHGSAGRGPPSRPPLRRSTDAPPRGRTRAATSGLADGESGQRRAQATRWIRRAQDTRRLLDDRSPSAETDAASGPSTPNSALRRLPRAAFEYQPQYRTCCSARTDRTSKSPPATDPRLVKRSTPHAWCVPRAFRRSPR